VNAFQRKFVNQVRRSDEMERKLRYLKETKKDGTPMLDTGENPDAPQPREMIDLEVSQRCDDLSFVRRFFPCLKTVIQSWKCENRFKLTTNSNSFSYFMRLIPSHLSRTVFPGSNNQSISLFSLFNSFSIPVGRF
jgi:hypothetical protein